MSENTMDSIISRNPLFHSGFTQCPNLLLDFQAELKIEPNELNLVLQLWRRMWDGTKHFTLRDISDSMGKTRMTVSRIAQALEKKHFLIRTTNEEGDSDWDLDQLLAAISELSTRNVSVTPRNVSVTATASTEPDNGGLEDSNTKSNTNATLSMSEEKFLAQFKGHVLKIKNVKALQGSSWEKKTKKKWLEQLRSVIRLEDTSIEELTEIMQNIRKDFDKHPSLSDPKAFHWKRILLSPIKFHGKIRNSDETVLERLRSEFSGKATSESPDYVNVSIEDSDGYTSVQTVHRSEADSFISKNGGQIV